MTNEKIFGWAMRGVGVPVVLVFLAFGCYSFFGFWKQEMIAKKLYAWKPVTAMSYEIKEMEQPEWPTDDGPPENTAEYVAWLEELKTMEEVMYTSDKNEYTISIHYQYQYAGQEIEGTALSPFPELNQQALRDKHFRRYLLRADYPKLTVYVDPSNPARSALVRGWAQGDRWGALVIGGFLVPISLAMLYYLVRPVRRVEDLFR